MPTQVGNNAKGFCPSHSCLLAVKTIGLSPLLIVSAFTFCKATVPQDFSVFVAGVWSFHLSPHIWRQAAAAFSGFSLTRRARCSCSNCRLWLHHTVKQQVWETRSHQSLCFLALPLCVSVDSSFVSWFKVTNLTADLQLPIISNVCWSLKSFSRAPSFYPFYLITFETFFFQSSWTKFWWAESLMVSTCAVLVVEFLPWDLEVFGFISCQLGKDWVRGLVQSWN